MVKLSSQNDSSSQSDPQQWGFDELAFTDRVISDDSKNYHAWQHRRWAVTHFKMPADGELQYTEALIQQDVYNNSAWSHRFGVVTQDEGLTPSVLERVSLLLFRLFLFLRLYSNNSKTSRCLVKNIH